MQSGHNDNSNNKSHSVLYGISGYTVELNPLQLGEDIIPVGEMLFARHTVNFWQSLLERPVQQCWTPALSLVIIKQLTWELCTVQRMISLCVKINAVSGNGQNNKILLLVCEKSQVVLHVLL